MAARSFWPAEPTRWIYARRGTHRAVQHVLAQPTDFDKRMLAKWGRMSSRALCGAEIGDGRYTSHGVRRSSRGPKTERPKVTVDPVPDLDLCGRCVHAVGTLQGENYRVLREAVA